MNTSTEKLILKLQKEKDAIQKAKIIQYLHVEKTLSLKEIAEKVQIHPSYISHYLRILQLPPIVLDGYYAKQISSAHLFILSRLKSEADIEKAYEEILAHNFNTTRAEELIREIKFSVNTTSNQLSKERRDTILEDINRAFPGIKIKIIQSRIKGKIILELKGDTVITSEFLKQVADKLSKKSYPEVFNDQHQVPE